jgi:hypothetical protein
MANRSVFGLASAVLLLWQGPARADQPVPLWTLTTEYPAPDMPGRLAADPAIIAQVEADAREVGAAGWTCGPTERGWANVTLAFRRPGAARKARAWLCRRRYVAPVLREPPTGTTARPRLVTLWPD